MGALAQIVVGLGFGDEGKGTTVDWLARRPDVHTVVRFNGGAQAGHNVVLPDRRHHCFAQFGAGTFGGVRTHLSKFMLVNPITALSEATALERVGVPDPFALMSCHEDALITTPFHVSMNRLEELDRGDRRHGSCGMGIGQTVGDSLAHPELAIRVGDLRDPATLRCKLATLQDLKIAQIYDAGLDDEPSVDLGIILAVNMVEIIEAKFARFRAQIQIVDDAWLQNRVIDGGTTIFEGAQGVLLDETYGFAPYNTWSTTTFHNAERLLEGLDVQIQRLGVTRSFHTRHGAGPFVTENERLQALDDHNQEGPWQGRFRVGRFDLVAFQYAIDVVERVDGVVLTWADSGLTQRFCSSYDFEDKRIWRLPIHERLFTDDLFQAKPVYDDLVGDLRDLVSLAAPVVLTSHGRTHADKTVHGDLLA